MPKKLNRMMVREMETRYREAADCVVVDPTGMGGIQAAQLRQELREAGVALRLVKNSLARLALPQTGLAGALPCIQGPAALAVGGDPAVVARRLVDWRRKNGVPAIRGGVVGGKTLTPAEVERLAALPPRPVLLAQMVGSLGAPLTGFVWTLQGVLQKFVGVLRAVGETKPKIPEAPGAAGSQAKDKQVQTP